jgi:hypothetical protein
MDAARGQWDTVKKLLKLGGPVDDDTRRQVAEQAAASQTLLYKRRSATPIARDPQAETLEELAHTLEEVISESEDSDPRTSAA